MFDYDAAGRIFTTEGTWHAGTEGPAAMIMPSDPQIGDTNRPENMPGTVFEEVTVTKVDQTREAPSGPVSGVMVATETHQDGTLSDKVFAPGYGEFLSTDGPDVEAMALASPTDSLAGGVPAELTTISDGADRIFSSRLASPAQWGRAERIAMGMVDAWNSFRGGRVPEAREAGPYGAGGAGGADRIPRSLEGSRRVDRRLVRERQPAAPLSARDRDRHDPVRAVGPSRAGACDRTFLGGVRSDLVTIEWIRDRFVHTVDPVIRTRIDTLVRDLGTAVVDDDLGAAADTARALRNVVAALI